MGVVVLQPRDCLNDTFPRNNLTLPHRHKNSFPNRRRRSPPRHQMTNSPPSPPVSAFIPKGSKKKNLNNSHVRILKRGEEIGDKIPDLAIEKPDLKLTRLIRSDPVTIPSQIRSDPVTIVSQILSDPVTIPSQTQSSYRKPMPALFYAGPVTSTSPPPSEVPLPAFFVKKSVSVFKPADATNDLIRILRLDIA